MIIFNVYERRTKERPGTCDGAPAKEGRGRWRRGADAHRRTEGRHRRGALDVRGEGRGTPDPPPREGAGRRRSAGTGSAGRGVPPRPRSVCLGSRYEDPAHSRQAPVNVIAAAVVIARPAEFHDPHTRPWSAPCAVNTSERIRRPAEAGVG